MRLIDADALKTAFEDTVCIEPMPYAFVKQIIDNAPTIKTFTLLDIEENFKKGLNIGLSYAPEDRPQGEWNYIQSGMCVCPFCGAMPHKLYKNFCAKCGADMRGTNEE